MTKKHHKNYNNYRIEYLLLRDKVFTLLGDKCSQCDWNDPRALQIDHKIAWSEDKNQPKGLNLYRALIAGKVRLEDYQLLCANHNWIKRIERNENKCLDERSELDKLRKKFGPQVDQMIEQAKKYKGGSNE